jgi:hypothetical protein
MIGASESDRQYRRGMVLGLTMAEIMLLLIFLLLLILAARLIEERKAAHRAILARDKAVTEKTDAENKLAEAQKQLDDLRRANPEGFDITKEYEKAIKRAEKAEKDAKVAIEERDKAKSAIDKLKEVTKDKPKMTDEEAIQEVKRLAELGKQIEQQAAAMLPGAMPEDAMRHFQDSAKVGDPALKSGKSPEELIAGATCQQDLDQCKQGNIDLSTRLAQKGGTLPSCWIDGIDGSTQFIFIATLRNDGIYLEENPMPGREADRADLPIAPLRLNHVYEPNSFVRDGTNLFNWSTKQEPQCRFYVRLRDETSNDKARYKALKERGVEQIFYIKLEN